MESAFSTKANRAFTASEFESLSLEAQKEHKTSFICLGCGEGAWFRAATKPTSKVNRGAHFNSHHQGECEFKTTYTLVDDEGESSQTADHSIPAVTDYVVNLDDKVGGAINDFTLDPIPPEGFVITPKGGAIGKGRGVAYETSASKTLRQLLSYLKRYPDFRFSDKSVELYSESGRLKVQGQIRNVAVHFDSISPNMDDDRNRLFWGSIVDSDDEAYGGIWLNASDSKSGLSIKIFADIKDRFLDVFKIKELKDLQGAYVLLVGKLHYTGKNNKPIIFCSIVNLVTIQKYREQ